MASSSRWTGLCASLWRFSGALALAATLVACSGGGDGTDGQDAAGGTDVASTDATGETIADVPSTDAPGPLDVPPGDGLPSDAPPPDVPPADVPPPDVPPADVPPADVPADVAPTDPCDPNRCTEAHRAVCDASDAAPGGYTCSCDLGYVEDENGDCVEDTESCTGAGDCDDGRFCNGAETCSPGAEGAAPNGCFAGQPPAIDDGDPCTADTCVEDADAVVHEALRCPSNAHCDPAQAECVCDAGFQMNEVGLCRACEVDPQEDNDSPATAKPAAQARGMRLSVDPADVDWYVIEACAGGTVSIEIYFDNQTGDINGYLYLIDGETLVASGTSTSADEAFSWVSDVDGDILLKVALDGGSCNLYSMNYTVTGCATCLDDLKEPNDDRASATEVGDAVGQTLVLGTGSPDWFHIDSCLDQQLRFGVRYDTTAGDVNVRLLPWDSDSSMAPAIFVDGGKEIAWTVNREGDYYFVVEAADDFTCLPYEVTLERSGCGAGDCESDALEDNDTPATAAALTGAAGLDLGVTAADPDWFTVDLCAGENITITPAPLTEPMTASQIRVAAMSADGGTVWSEGTAADITSARYTALVDEPLLVRVTTTAAECEPYRLEVNRSGCLACTDDANEDDDDVDSARPLAVDGEAPGMLCGHDEDWFVVTLCEGSSPRLSVYAGAGQGVVATDLLAADGVTVVGGVASGEGGAEIRLWGLEGGTYYVRHRLLADDGDPGLDYTLVLEEVCCPPDVAEPNDEPAAAVVPTAELSTAGFSVAPGAEDWFQIATCPDTTNDIEILYNAPDGFLDGVLLADDLTTVLAEGETTATGERFVYAGTAEGVAYLKVTGVVPPEGFDGGYCVQYSLYGEGGLNPCAEPAK